MADVHSKETRSYNMSRIKSRNTKPEVLLRKALWSNGIRFRIHVKNMPGKPDIVINKHRLAIFVDGGFWHGYQWEKKRSKIKSNADFWIKKIESNMRRDMINQRRLQEVGYTVMRFWDHDVTKNLNKCINQILLFLEASKDQTIPSRNLFI
ncbi:very short patch repair endonuclease [Pedobacter sp. KBS0701]|uniref:very short patch repair endonuclease n=1 Tax=Pedobacter sp. KBS0701 TaxID=2578106 RepID=UPI00110D9969|nr:very short patch repair endonuclease [Pedobacter sp. KBS0701]QDW25235.1 very short patch repair endonuclease [Pedobacter sp. KBS0701]